MEVSSVFCPLQLSVPMGLLTRGLKLLLLASAEKHKDVKVCMAQSVETIQANTSSIYVIDVTFDIKVHAACY